MNQCHKQAMKELSLLILIISRLALFCVVFYHLIQLLGFGITFSCVLLLLFGAFYYDSYTRCMSKCKGVVEETEGLDNIQKNNK